MGDRLWKVKLARYLNGCPVEEETLQRPTAPPSRSSSRIHLLGTVPVTLTESALWNGSNIWSITNGFVLITGQGHKLDFTRCCPLSVVVIRRSKRNFRQMYITSDMEGVHDPCNQYFRCVHVIVKGGQFGWQESRLIQWTQDRTGRKIWHVVNWLTPEEIKQNWNVATV